MKKIFEKFAKVVSYAVNAVVRFFEKLTDLAAKIQKELPVAVRNFADTTIGFSYTAAYVITYYPMKLLRVRKETCEYSATTTANAIMFLPVLEAEVVRFAVILIRFPFVLFSALASTLFNAVMVKGLDSLDESKGEESVFKKKSAGLHVVAEPVPAQ